ncbi:MAG: hypothetical protein AAF989_04190 [Planctomycetota bacterium]
MATVIGCGSRIDTVSLSVVQPPTIEVEGTEWSKVEWTTNTDAKVAGHLRRFPYLMDNPSLSGSPVCNQAGSKERVHWLATSDETSTWAMVEFNGSRGGELVEGSDWAPTAGGHPL